MVAPIERVFGEKFLKSIDNFYTHGIDWLFNEWWETAPADAIAKYEEAILDHPDHGPLAREGGPVINFVCGRAVEHYVAMALMNRSPKMTANWAFAMVHSRGGIFHSFSDRFKIR